MRNVVRKEELATTEGRNGPSDREQRILGIIETARGKRAKFRDDRITMAHGAGGKATSRLVEGLLAPAFGIETLICPPKDEAMLKSSLEDNLDEITARIVSAGRSLRRWMRTLWLPAPGSILATSSGRTP